jgi:hypothetical protein
MVVIGGTLGPIVIAGAPGAGTDAVQTLTFGGTPTGGTFVLTFEGFRTAPIAWSSVNATLIAAIDAALEALANIGAGGVVTAVGTMTAGIGTATVTFSGAAMAKRTVGTIVADGALLTGTTPTLAVANTTPGVEATGAGAAKGALLIDTTTPAVYQNSGTPPAVTWAKVGLQT